MRLPPERTDSVWSRLRQHDVEELWDHSIAPHVAAAYAARTTLLLDMVRGIGRQGLRIIDVGCAQGTVGLMLAEEGHQVTLLDIQPEALEYARGRYETGAVEYMVGRAEEVESRGLKFDLAICTEVVEHVPRPAQFIATLATLYR